MLTSQQSEWVLCCRRYFATLDETCLQAAVDACVDSSVKRLLSHPDFAVGRAASEQLQPVTSRLREAGKQAEAAIIEMTALRVYLRAAANPNQLTRDVKKSSLQMCQHFLSLCKAHHFQECGAAVALALGDHYLNLQSWTEAAPFFREAVAGLRSLFGTDPDTYRPHLVEALNKLADVLRHTGVGNEAELLFKEAFELRLANPAADAIIETLLPALNTAQWVLHARRFVATDVESFLEEAIDTCTDERVRSLLKQDEFKHGCVEKDVFGPLVEQLTSEGRHAEAGILMILSIRGTLVAEAPEQLSPKERETMVRGCSYGALISKRHSFADCEAKFVRTLGTYFAKVGEWDEAEVFLTRAGNLYLALAKADADLYRADVALTFNHLAVVLTHQRKFAEATHTFGLALEIREMLATIDPQKYESHYATSLSGLGNLLRSQRHFDDAERIYRKAVDTYRGVADKSPSISRHGLCVALSNLGAVLCDSRRFVEAEEVYKEASQAWAALPRDEQKAFGDQLSGMLSNLGAVLLEQHRVLEALAAFDSAVTIFKSLVAVPPNVYRVQLAAALNNRGKVLLAQGRSKEAEEAFLEAAGMFREEGEELHHEESAVLATVLNNAGGLQYLQKRDMEALVTYQKAAHIYRGLALSDPDVSTADLVSILNNLGNVLVRLGRWKDALDVSDEAVRIVERSTGPYEELWLAKGRAEDAYKRLLVEQVDNNRVDEAFRVLIAVREREARALRCEDSWELGRSVEALARVEQQVGRGIRILVAQETVRDGMLIGFLQTQGPHLQLARAEEFRSCARDLVTELRSVFDTKTCADGSCRLPKIEDLCAKSWAHLPDFVQDGLAPDAPYDVLVSGDGYWAFFPWEAVRFGSGNNDYLGLRRPMARWNSLSAGGIDRLGLREFGRGARSAAIVCPWDAIGGSHLQGARKEAERIVVSLASLGGEGSGAKPHVTPTTLVGSAATPEAMREALTCPLCLLHYTGHGALVGNEEVLVLGGMSEKREPAYFGRKELRDLKAESGSKDRLFTHGPLFVLNSCFTGRARDFGGQREDLAWTLLDEGAQAVIASALPVSDFAGTCLGALLYEASSQRKRGFGWTIAYVRAVIREACRLRKHSTLFDLEWALLAYHGNPYAQLPCANLFREQTSEAQASCTDIEAAATMLVEAIG